MSECLEWGMCVWEVEVKAGDDKGNMHAAISAIAVHTLQDKGSDVF